MAHPHLGIMAIYLSNHLFEEMSYFRKLSLKGKSLGIQVMVFSPEDVDSERKKINGWFYADSKKRWIRRWASFPDVIYDRCRNQTATRFYQLKQFRNKYPHLLYLNRPLSNKWGIYKILRQNEQIRPHLPYTVKFSSFHQVQKLLQRKHTLYLKPSNGTGGRGIIRIRPADQGRMRIEGRDASRRIIPEQKLTIAQLNRKFLSWPLRSRYLVQQGIDLRLQDGRVHDYRVLMQKNSDGQWTMTGCAGRIGPYRSITSNLHGGGTAVKMERLLRRRFSSESQIAEIKQAIERLGQNTSEYIEKRFGKLCELGLDIAVDPRGHPWLLEINPKPSREVFRRIGEKHTYNTAIMRPLQYALWVLKQSDNHAKNKE